MSRILIVCVYIIIMRREFILVLLGIICISMLSSLLSGYVQYEPNKILLDSVVGVISAGNFSYWQLGHTGPLYIELISLYGDADLYVADNMRPSYEADRNNFSSVTCGPDTVNIPPEFPRPIGIGIFGHWSHLHSEYTIQVFLDTTKLRNDEQLLPIEQAQQAKAKRSDMEGKRNREKAPSWKSEDEKPKYLKFLNLLDMIFDMFVL